jgi:hypothetical protein
VADLIGVDPVRLSRLGGVAEATRVELRDLARLWRERFGAAVAAHSRGGGDAVRSTGATVPTPAAAADLLLAGAGEAGAVGRRRVARLILGRDQGASAFASQLELATVLGVSRARVAQLAAGLQRAWAHAAPCDDLLEALATVARGALLDLGGVATADEMSSALLAAMAPAEEGAGREPASRLTAGLLRLALDRSAALERAQAEAEPFSARRRDGRIAILATDPALLDAAEALGQAADALALPVAPAAGLVPARRAAAHLRDALARVTSGGVMRVDDARLVRLGAGLATKAALSGAGDLHHRDLSPAVALSVALGGVGATERIRVQEIRQRVRARFPALPALPDRPRLDQIVEDAGLGLVYDEAEQAFRGRTVGVGTGGLESRLATLHPSQGETVTVGWHIAERLRESRSKRSFLALGVDAAHIPRALEVLRHDFDAEVLDLTRALLDAIRAAASATQPPIPWEKVRAADAALPDSREATGLARLVALAIPEVDAAVEAVLGGAPRGARPLVLTEAAALARYSQLGMLSRWADLASPRAEAAWLLVPQLLGNQGAVIDGRPIPLAAPGQFMRLDAEWIDAHAWNGRAVKAASP